MNAYLVRSVNKGEKSWLTSFLYLFNLIDKTTDTRQLHAIPNSDLSSSIVNKLESMFKEKFSVKEECTQNCSCTVPQQSHAYKKTIFECEILIE